MFCLRHYHKKFHVKLRAYFSQMARIRNEISLSQKSLRFQFKKNFMRFFEFFLCLLFSDLHSLSTAFILSVLSSTDISYVLYFTGVSPLNLRLFFINTYDQKTAIRIGIYWSKPNRLDVFANNKFISPNAKQRLPTMDQPAGSNALDVKNRLLYVIIRGDTVIDIRLQSVVVINFEIPAMTIDDFFRSDVIVQNLALFLGIPKSKVSSQIISTLIKVLLFYSQFD